MRTGHSVVVTLLTLVVSCGAPSTAPPPAGVIISLPSASTSAPAPSGSGAPIARADPPAKGAELPEWLMKRAAGAATALVGGDADTIDVLFGQFEQPQEAIVRFDRKTGCARDVIGPWPTLTKIVRGRSDSAHAKSLTREETLALAHSTEMRKELASIVEVYAKRGNRGEDKLAFSLDGKSLMMEASDEHLIASKDGGEHWTYLEGKSARMPNISPDGRYAIVQMAGYGGPGLVSFETPSRVRQLGAPHLNDAIFGASSSSVVLARTDPAGRATRICLEKLDLPVVAGPKKLACVATTETGSWHVTSPSLDGRLAVIAVAGKKGAVRLSVRSLVNGAEQEAFDVPGVWERYQWISVMVNDRGVVAYDQGVRSGPFGVPDRPDGKAVVQGGGVPRREIPSARPLGWLNERELVYVDFKAIDEPHGCGLLGVLDVTRTN